MYGVDDDGSEEQSMVLKNCCISRTDRREGAVFIILIDSFGFEYSI